MIVDAFLFAWANGPSGGAHRHLNIVVRVQWHPADSRLASPGRGRKDNQEATALTGRLVHGRSCFGRAVPVKRRNVAPHKKTLEMVRRNAYCALQHIWRKV